MPGIEESLSSLGFTGNPASLALSATAQGFGAFTNLIGSFNDKKQAKEIERNAGPRPKMAIPGTILDNQSLLESEAANGGLSDDATVSFQNQLDRDFNNAMRNVLLTGGGPNSISGLYDSQADAGEQLALINEELRQKKIVNLAKQNETMADWMNTQWEVNEFAPWADQMQKAAELRKSARARSDKALSMFGAGANNIATSMLMSDQGHTPGSYSGAADVTPESKMISRYSNSTPAPDNTYRPINTPNLNFPQYQYKFPG